MRSTTQHRAERHKVLSSPVGAGDLDAAQALRQRADRMVLLETDTDGGLAMR
jgi:hypothetical protein